MGNLISYVENEDKTLSVISNPEEDLSDVIAYASRDEATHQQKFVDGINVNPETAREEMMYVKHFFGKEDGTLAYHGYQSFKEGEVTPELAHDIGKELAEELWGDRFQVLVCTHLDKSSHIHNHFLINTVSMVDGKKFYRSKSDYKKMQEVSDRLCREHGLSVIEKPERKAINHAEWNAERNGKPTYKSMVRNDIDRAIAMSVTESEFITAMENLGYEFKFYAKSGKLLERPSLKPKGSERFFRFDNLGEDYDISEIKNRIDENIRREVPFPEAEQKEIKNYRIANPPKTKHKGFAALYFHYCYELHIIVKHPASAKQISYFMREDLIKLDKLDEQTRFLGRNKIYTIDDLNSYRSKSANEIGALTKERDSLRNKLKRQKRANNTPEIEATKIEIKKISDNIHSLRHDLEICDAVETRSARMQNELDNLAKAREEPVKGKEDHTELER